MANWDNVFQRAIRQVTIWKDCYEIHLINGNKKRFPGLLAKPADFVTEALSRGFSVEKGDGCFMATRVEQGSVSSRVREAKKMAEEAKMSKEELESMTVKELRARARELGIECSRLRKHQLLTRLGRALGIIPQPQKPVGKDAPWLKVQRAVRDAPSYNAKSILLKEPEGWPQVLRVQKDADGKKTPLERVGYSYDNHKGWLLAHGWKLREENKDKARDGSLIRYAILDRI